MGCVRVYLPLLRTYLQEGVHLAHRGQIVRDEALERRLDLHLLRLVPACFFFFNRGVSL